MPTKCITSPTGDYTHMGRYLGATADGMTHGTEYNLIYEGISDSVTFVNDDGEWYWADGDKFSVTHDYGSHQAYPNRVPQMKRRKRTPSIATVQDDDAPLHPVWDDDLPAEEDCDTTGLEAIARDVEPEPEGPASTEQLRKYRFTPDIF